MLKKYLLDSIIKEMKICRRLSSKIPNDQLNYRLKDDTRTILELLQYLSYVGPGTIRYWYKTDTSDFRTFFLEMRSKAPAITSTEQFLVVIDEQIELIKQLFEKISEEDLHTKMVDYPWGDKAPLGEAIIETNIKWLTGYKLQLFTMIKNATGQKLGTPDAWRLTEIEKAVS